MQPSCAALNVQSLLFLTLYVNRPAGIGFKAFIRSFFGEFSNRACSSSVDVLLVYAMRRGGAQRYCISCCRAARQGG